MRRREVIAGALAGAAAQLASAQSAPSVKPGIDLFSIRSSGWSPFESLDYCAKLQARVVHFSEIRFLGNLEPEHMKKVRAHSEKHGIELEIGMRSICPTSKSFDPKAGSAEEQLTRVIDAAKVAGAKLVRAFLGSMADRTGGVPIAQHIANTVKVLRAVRSRAVDSGLKIAIENHAGDMQGRELKWLIEEAGKDFVGACIDSGNPTWAIEDPHVTLETLAPYVLTCHLRDSAVWRVPEGAAVAWVRTGEGNVNIGAWIDNFVKLCPGRALSMEVIVTQPRVYAYHKPEFWDAYKETPAWEFARFVALADRGTARTIERAPKEQAAQREREDLEASLAWVRRHLKIA